MAAYPLHIVTMYDQIIIIIIRCYAFKYYLLTIFNKALSIEFSF